MIDDIRLLKNIGTFDSKSVGGSIALNKLTLIYAENGRGKTTLAAVLRSLATGNPQPIEERWRFGSDHSPHVVLQCRDQPSGLVFQNGAWNKTLPDLKIFDDTFVDENVHSGLDVEAHHRQNLHDFILGDQGVALSRRIQELGICISQHTSTLREKADSIPQHVRGGLSMEDFCALPEVPDIDAKTVVAERELVAAQDREELRNASMFARIHLPEFDLESINQTLQSNLPDLDRTAEARVQAHVRALGEGGESWVEEGIRGVRASDDGACPFCGQGLDGLSLVAHYRSYFSENYTLLKKDVTDQLECIDLNHADGAQAKFERAVGLARQVGQFWATYADVPKVDIDTAAIELDWKAAREAITDHLEAKRAAPLERLELEDHALKTVESYNLHRQVIRGLNERLTSCNEKLHMVQLQAEATDVKELRAQLNVLKATKARFSDEFAPLCENFVQEMKAKNTKEREKNATRDALEEYRAKVFPAIEEGVNDYLQRFSAGFRIKSLEPSNIGSGSGSTCTYNVDIDNNQVAVKSSTKVQGEPSFRSSLSAGDRNTLALALFFSSLDQNPNLAKTIVVVDDPMSSLDDHRSLATVQEVRKLSGRAGQVIVLSHDKSFLCGVWRHANSEESCSLELRQSGTISNLLPWNVSQDSITEHDQRHKLLEKYADKQCGDKREVGAAIRLHLEGFLRIMYPGNYSTETLLGHFIGICREKLGHPTEIMSEELVQELADISEYGNLFHHDTNQAWQNTAINGNQLLGYVRRTLKYCSAGRWKI